ncbi:MAG: AAA family ATPase [Bacteroidetes bacterium QS_8_68_28]|nr:MAG: AAA family ATPase [Bacteroidetes bacterium QS_8_68_28]
MAQHGRNNGDEPDQKSDGGGGFGVMKWMLLLLTVGLTAHLLFNWSPGAGKDVEYSKFLDQVEQGLVKEVSIINNTRIEGTYRQEAIQSGAVEPGDSGSDLLGGGSGSGEERRRFTTTKTDNHDLTGFLRKHNQNAGSGGQKVAFSARQEENWLGTLLVWAIPLGLLVVLWLYFARKMGPGSQVLNIGKSKANVTEAEEDHDVNFEDVAGLDEAKEEVVEVVDFLKDPEKFTKLGGQLPKGVLLVGQPGTGKTLMAKAVAGEAGVPFFSLSGSDFVEMFVGVGASRVRDLFKKAKEEAPCIIFIDEIDAIGRSRGRNSMVGGNDERENTLNQLLSEMDGFDSDKGVIIMAATNRPDVLDSALMRPGRFDRQIMIDKPDRRSREMIFEVHVKDILIADDVNLEVLAGQTPGFAGAEIANVCNEAALLAARKDKDAIGMDDFEQSIDRVIGGLEKKNKIISPEEREIIAYHESGHAIVGWFLKHTDPVVKVSIVPRGMAALGYSQSMPEERYLYSKQALLDRMAMMLGGRVAEEIVFGEVTTGAQNDLQRITKMAYAMVTDYGMSDKVGNVSFNMSSNGEEGGGGEQPMFEKPYSDDTARAIDEEAKALIDEVRTCARELLEEKRDMLDAMAETLLEEEVIGPEKLVGLLGERPHGDYVALRNGRANGHPKNGQAESGQAESGGEASGRGPHGVDAEGEPATRPPEPRQESDDRDTNDRDTSSNAAGDGAPGQTTSERSSTTLRPREDDDDRPGEAAQ